MDIFSLIRFGSPNAASRPPIILGVAFVDLLKPHLNLYAEILSKSNMKKMNEYDA